MLGAKLKAKMEHPEPGEEEPEDPGVAADETSQHGDAAAPGAMRDEGEGGSPLVPASCRSPFHVALPGTIQEDASVGGESAESLPVSAGDGGRESQPHDIASRGSLGDTAPPETASAGQPLAKAALSSIEAPSALPTQQGGAAAGGSRVSGLKGTVWTTLNNPLSSNTSAALALLVIVFVVCSTITTLVYTLPTSHHSDQTSDGSREHSTTSAWFIAESTWAAFFTLEASPPPAPPKGGERMFLH